MSVFSVIQTDKKSAFYDLKDAIIYSVVLTSTEEDINGNIVEVKLPPQDMAREQIIKERDYHSEEQTKRQDIIDSIDSFIIANPSTS